MDHPHACGDKLLCLYLFTVPIGSSPCVWGKVVNVSADNYLIRIIPMRVGTSIEYVLELESGKDHPHACGDKSFSSCTISLALGSSPCVWGQVKVRTPLGRVLGIIPMRVGTSGVRSSAFWVVKDHPHACGDKGSLQCNTAKSLGSSPCVWGQGKILTERNP